MLVQYKLSANLMLCCPHCVVCCIQVGNTCATQGAWTCLQGTRAWTYLQGASVTLASRKQLTHRYLHAAYTHRYSRFAPVLYQTIGTPYQINIITSQPFIITLCLRLYPIHLPRDHLKACLCSRVSIPTQNCIGWQLPFVQGRGVCCPLCLHNRVTLGVVIDRNNDTENRPCVIHRYFIIFVCLLDCNQISWLKI